MNLLKKWREHALLVFCFCESIFLRCSYPSIFPSFFSLSLLRSFVRSFFYTLIFFIFFLSFLFFLAKETVVFLFLTFCPFFPVIMNMKSRQLIRSWRYSLFQDGQSNCSPPSCPKTNCASGKTIIPEGECFEICKGTFFSFSFVHKPSILTLEIVESAYERKNRELASFTGPQIFAVGRGGGGRRKKKVGEQAKNIPKQVVNT